MINFPLIKCTKARQNYSASFWINHFSISLRQGQKTSHLHGFGDMIMIPKASYSFVCMHQIIPQAKSIVLARIGCTNWKFSCFFFACLGGALHACFFEVGKLAGTWYRALVLLRCRHVPTNYSASRVESRKICLHDMGHDEASNSKIHDFLISGL